MDRSDKSGCLFEGRLYPHDSEVCTGTLCMICRDGDWEETTELFPSKDSGILAP